MSESRSRDIKIHPLRKLLPDGSPYSRVTETDESLRELVALADGELIRRSEEKNRQSPDYIKSECLLYLVRNKNRMLSRRVHEQLFKTLLERVMKATWSGKRDDTIDLTASRIHQELTDRFLEMLLRDQAEYVEGLDFYEIRFDKAVASLRRDVRKVIEREQGRGVPLEDPETEEISVQVEEAVGVENPIAGELLDRQVYRLRLAAAIDTLPPLQRRIVEMLKNEIPIESNDAHAVTISKLLGKTSKTIRTNRDLAFAELKRILKSGEES